MPSWYLVKTRYQKENEMGQLQTINEAHLFDALSYTESEAAAYKNQISGNGDFMISAINRMRLADMFMYETGEKWFKVKVVYHSIDEKSGKDKKVVNYMLVNADGIVEALERIQESLKTMLIPYEITDINLTPIMEVYPYREKTEEEAEVPDNFRPVSEVIDQLKREID